jgi:hypothetical protein
VNKLGYKLTTVTGKPEGSKHDYFHSRQEVDNYLDSVAEWQLRRITHQGSAIEVYYSPQSDYCYIIEVEPSNVKEVSI